MKKFVAILFGLLAIAVAAVLVGPSFVDWSAYKPEITAEVEKQTGRKLTIGGAIDLQILPTPRLSVADVRLSNPEGAADPDLVRLESFQIHIALRPLLGGAVKISSVTLIKPIISLEKLADGRTTWTLDGSGGTEAAGTGQGGSAGAPSPGDGVTVSLDAADIIDGQVIYRDAATGALHQIDDLDAKLSAASLGGPFSVRGSGAYKGLAAEVTGKLGKIDAGRAAAVMATVSLPTAGGAATFDGTVDLDSGPLIKGALEVTGEDLTKLVDAVAATAPPAPKLPAGLAKTVRLTASVTAGPDGVALDDLQGEIGEIRVAGKLSAELADLPRIAVDLALGRVDLDALGIADMAASQAAGATAAPSGGAGDGESGEPAGFTLPTGIAANVNVSADAIGYRGQTIRQLKLETALVDGAVTVDVATAQLPGGTDVTVSGTLYADTGLPRFVGRADVVSDNLRTLLNWFDQPLDGLAADRLRKGTFGAEVDLSPAQVQLKNWTTAIDSTEIAGGLTLLLRDRPAFGLSLVIDKVNLDAYLPNGAASKQAPAKASGEDAKAAGGGADLTALLSSFDANLLIKVGEARYQNTVIRGADLDATVQSGEIELRNLSVTDVAGASVKIAGALAGTIEDPRTDLTMSVDAKSAARLIRLAGIEPDARLKQLGGFRLSSKVRGSPQSLELDADLKAAGGDLGVTGTVRPMSSPPGLDLQLRLDHPKAQELVGLISGDASVLRYALGPATARAMVKSGTGGQVDLETRIDVAGSRIGMRGTVDPFAPVPAVDARVSFAHPSIVKLIRVAAPKFKPSRDQLGPAKADFILRGDANKLSLTEVDLTLGAVELAGEAGLDLSAARPLVTAKLSTDTIDAALWAPPDAPKPQGAVPAVPVKTDGRAWSREKIDLAGLHAVDADVEVTAARILYTPYVFDTMSMKARLQGGRLDVHQFSGGLFGGRVAATARLIAADIPVAEFVLKVDNADIRRAVAAAAQSNQVSGILDYETSLSTRGASEYEMVNALQGDGRFKIRDGEVEGIDLPAVSDQLKALDRALDFVVLAQRAMRGGSTPIDSLVGSYTITDGVLRSDDVLMKSPAAEGKSVALVNLPAQEMDAQSRFWLSEHPNSPPIGVRNVGPLANPRTILDVEKMQAYVLQRVVQRGILRQFGKPKVPEAAPATPVEQAPTQEEQQPVPLEKLKPRDALRGILQNLLKN